MWDGSEGTEIDVLPLWSVRVAGVSLHPSCEVSDAIDHVVGEKSATERVEVQPLMRRPFQAAVVEVEPVHIDIGLHRPDCRWE